MQWEHIDLPRNGKYDTYLWIDMGREMEWEHQLEIKKEESMGRKSVRTAKIKVYLRGSMETKYSISILKYTYAWRKYKLNYKIMRNTEPQVEQGYLKLERVVVQTKILEYDGKTVFFFRYQKWPFIVFSDQNNLTSHCFSPFIYIIGILLL